METLLDQYNKEIDFIKEKLLNKESWDNLVENRNKVRQLGIELQKEQLTERERIFSRIKAEFPQ